MGFELDGKTYETDEDGYLIDIGSWTKEVADYFAIETGLDGLTEKHWQVVNFLRDYYSEYQIAPMVKILIKSITKSELIMGDDVGNKRGASKMLYELFPLGPGIQACKIAGLPKPTGCV